MDNFYIQIQKWTILRDYVSKSGFLPELNKLGLLGMLKKIRKDFDLDSKISMKDLQNILMEQKISFCFIKFAPRPKISISRLTTKLFCQLLAGFIMARDRYHIVWVDESAICPSNFKKNHWTYSGKTQLIIEPIPYQKLIILGAISEIGCLGLKIIKTGHCSNVFAEFLLEVISKITSTENSKRQLIVMMDNASIHKNAMLLDILVKNNILVLFNIPHHPQFNVIELFWERIKRPLRKIIKSQK